ncbi:hypothetical protein CK203_068140 [Vitis vinifera]|uniref:NYN domain-containing protein n=1 Tax=Vitis vinifera TaxID=29760 RepID=A0A438E1E5_VITVI|nr:hypothetical protein CK203_068140 [Vitis vinifera]
MGGDGNGGTAARATLPAEPQYVSVKTSVWWDIENCQVPKGCDPHAIAQNISSALAKLYYSGPVSISAYGDTNRIPASVQQALSSTGIALNHVPAGVKDASDKKILVDMLFWAVDNPAPANYLLISGDRDFSNALHQLRMRRYNILLAQPQKASAPLIAAAKSVWLWTSLVAGGFPLTSGESSQLADCNNVFNPEMSQYPVPETMQTSQPVDSNSDGLSAGTQKFFSAGRESNSFSHQPEYTQGKQFKKAPHEFFGASESVVSANGSTPNYFQGNPDSSGINGNNFIGNPQDHYPHPLRPNNIPTQASFASNNLYPPNSYSHGFRPMPPRSEGPRFPSAPPANVPDISRLSMSEYPNYAQNPPNFHQRIGGEYKPYSSESPHPPGLNVPQKGYLPHTSQLLYQDTSSNRYPGGPDLPAHSSSPVGANSVSSNGVWGSQGCPQPSEYVQDPKHQNTDVRKALESAVEQQMVVKQNLGAVQLYVGKKERLWKCVNPIGGNPNQYPKATWDRIQMFLATSIGRSAIMASQCKYEAALILRNKCLEEFALGDVLQILNMLSTMKKWIVNHQSGWQPITITLAETNTDINTETSA